MSVKWTPAQQEAITSRESNLLVAAGAGSGKTTVLVERVLGRLRQGGDIQRLLALTFTNAAAADMRRKIDSALAAELAANPNQPALSRAAALLPLSGISTLHSFCLDLLRKYYYRLNLSPNFRVAGEVEMLLLRQQVLDDLLEEEYADEYSPLIALADAYGGSRDDGDLAQLLLELHEFSRSRPDPAQWLLQAAEAYAAQPTLDDYPFAAPLRAELATGLRQALEAYRRAALHDAPLPWLELAELECAELARLLRVEGLEQALPQLACFEFSRLATINKAEREAGDTEQRERFKQGRDDVKEEVRRLQKRLTQRTPQQMHQDLARLQPLIAALAQLVLRFDSRLNEEKRSRSLVYFDDMEHLTLALLEQPEVAAELAAGYDEILVDEYQDINEVQEAILRRLAPEQGLFAVGDVKQSIYRFRLAEPGLFLDKYQRFGRQEGGRRIDLNRNYRSQQALISGINFLFSQLMVEQVAELDYDEAAQLYPGRDESGPLPELHLIDRSLATEPLAALIAEGRLIAHRLLELRGQGYAYADMAVLTRTVKAQQPLLLALREAGIPAVAEGDGAEWNSAERLLTLALLQVADNPHQDIPLAAVLRSPLFNLSDDDMAQLRLAGGGDYFQALSLAAGQEDALGALARACLEQLQRWRQLGHEGSPSQLLLDIYHSCGLMQLVGALPNGAERQRSLQQLLEQAYQYEATGYAGLFRFIRMLVDEQQSKRRAKGLSPGGQAVRLLTIHKSKGLEFPVAVVAGLYGEFNFDEQNKDVIWERALGIGSRVADREQRRKYPSLSHLAISRRLREQALAEEMRILYVALTRARERLLLVAAVPDVAAQAAKWAEQPLSEPTLPAPLLAAARRPLDWLGPALLRDAGAAELRALVEELPSPLSNEPCWRVTLSAPLPQVEQQQPASAAAPVVEGELRAQVQQALSYRYPYAEQCNSAAKWSVSALSRLAADEEEGGYLLPQAQEQASPGLDGAHSPAGAQMAAQRGSALHRCLELADFKQTSVEQLQAQLEQWQQRGLLSAEQAQLVDVQLLARFYAAGQGQALARAAQAQREIPFTYLLPHNGEQLLVQGIIDAAYHDGQGWVLLDYKTGGWGKSDFELAEHYRPQLAYYRRAIEQLWREPVRGVYLCMLDLGREVRLGKR